jgi:hypothetical protein
MRKLRHNKLHFCNFVKSPSGVTVPALRSPEIKIHSQSRYSPSWKAAGINIGENQRYPKRDRIFDNFRAFRERKDFYREFLSLSPSRARARARVHLRPYCFVRASRDRSPCPLSLSFTRARVCACFLIRTRRNYPTKFKTRVRTLLGGIVETAGRLLPRTRARPLKVPREVVN